MVTDLDTFAESLQQDILVEARQRYTAAVIEHWMHPRNWGSLSNPDGYARVTGSCGDTMEIAFRESNGVVAACRFTTDGCGAAIASGSVATVLLLGHPLDSARTMTEERILQALGGLPESDSHCALLAAGTVQEAIGHHDRISSAQAGRSDTAANPFDTLADRYDAWFDSDRGRRIFSVEADCIRELLIDMPRPWLEVGVGTGRFATALQVDEGVDPSPAVLKYASERGIRTRLGQAERLPYQDNRFGVALLIVTICFLQDPAEALAECRRVVRPDGCLIVGVVPKDSLWGKAYADKGRHAHPFYSAATFYSSREIIGIAEKAGFSPAGARSCLFEDPEAAVVRYQRPREGLIRGAGFVGLRFCSTISTMRTG